MTARHDVEPVVEIRQKVKPVLGDDNGLAEGLQIGEDSAKVLYPFVVEAGGRLVEENHLGVVDERRGYGDALLLSSREAYEVLARQMRDFHALESRLDPFDQLLARHAQILADEGHLVGRLAGEELVGRILEHVADRTSKLAGGKLSQTFPEKLDSPIELTFVLIGNQAVHGAHESGLPAPGVASEYDELAALHRKPHVLQCREIFSLV